jgi:hypothetical protein
VTTNMPTIEGSAAKSRTYLIDGTRAINRSSTAMADFDLGLLLRKIVSCGRFLLGSFDDHAFRGRAEHRGGIFSSIWRSEVAGVFADHIAAMRNMRCSMLDAPPSHHL